MAAIILLCPACGERLGVQRKTNTAGDGVVRRACPTGDYAEAWTPDAVAGEDGVVGIAHAGVQTAGSTPRIAPLPAQPLPTPNPTPNPKAV